MTTDRFDDLASTWDDDPMRRERATAVARAVALRVPLRSDMAVREEGSGTGLLGRLLLPEVGSLTLADPSEGMREEAMGRIPISRSGDVRVVDSFAPDSARYDVVVSLMALHHVPDALVSLREWASRLADGGWLFVADLDAEDGSFHGPDQTDVHLGFERETVVDWFRSLGLLEVGISTVFEIEKESGRFPVFLASGRRA